MYNYGLDCDKAWQDIKGHGLMLTWSNNHLIYYSYINYKTSDLKISLQSVLKRLKVTKFSSLKKKIDQKFDDF